MLKKTFIVVLCLAFSAPPALAGTSEKDMLNVLQKDKAADATIVRENKLGLPPKDRAVKEIVMLTVKPGDAIDYHEHSNDGDAYIITSGTGLFKDADGKESQVKAGDIAVCGKGQKHTIVNNGDTDLVMISIIAEQ